MWSGPRSISTALMRSWGSRADTFVCDEPFYAHYLLRTGAPHPGADEVIRSQETDPRKVAAWLTGPVPGGKPIFYQKHMAHHLLPEIERDWLTTLSNCLLIREPEGMLPSLAKITPTPRLEDTGLPQQVDLFQRLRERTGSAPPVIDAADVLCRPREMLAALCARLGAPFDENMLLWPAGPRATDGVWAKHWYASVEASTSFQPYAPKNDPLPPELCSLYEECAPLYEALHRHRLLA